MTNITVNAVIILFATAVHHAIIKVQFFSFTTIAVHGLLSL